MEGRLFFPDEKGVQRKLHDALATAQPVELSRLQIGIVLGWLEEQVGGHYGGGEVMIPEEEAVLDKLRQAAQGDS